jgi:protein involved in polysaccharide export with SLBB domain
MKLSLTLILMAVCLVSPIQSQEQRLRSRGGDIPEPSEYWEELKPVEMPKIAEKTEPSRVKPVAIPAWQTRYTLGPGDTLDFSVYDRPDLARKNVQIAPDGTISYLQAVAVQANGLTLDQLRKKIETELAQYQDAKVIISPVNIASKDIAIIGRVQKPGTYTLDRPTTILEALSLAQGIQNGTIRGSSFELADFDRSFVVRKGRKLDVDLGKLYYRGDFSQNAYLEPDDYIYIASNIQNEIYVIGNVNNPGRRKMPVKLTLTQAIAEAGGFDKYAYKMKVLLIRGSIHEPETQIINMRDVLNGIRPDVVLESKDIVFVNRRPFDMLERVLDTAVVTYLQTISAEVTNQEYTPIFNPN